MNIGIINSNISNTLSVQRAVEKLGYQATLTTTKSEVQTADALILPGVGAFSGGMSHLAEMGLLHTIQQCAKSGLPILGICLGMQMLFESSYEYGHHQGLGLLEGNVDPISSHSIDNKKLRVPHVGWEALLAPQGQATFSSPLLQHISPLQEVYFVHSFAANPKNPSNILAMCNYGGHLLCAAVGLHNVFGTQFHPEKSGSVGLAILNGFLQHANKEHTS